MSALAWIGLGLLVLALLFVGAGYVGWRLGGGGKSTTLPEIDHGPAGPAPTPSYEVVVGSEVRYRGRDLQRAKDVRAQLRKQFQHAVLYVDGEYRG